MDEHFRAFTFVDRIDAIEEGMRARGHYQIPPGIGQFPPSLVSEAIGQLAAWVAMGTVGFQFRPVAGIAGRVVFERTVRPGQRLDLTAVLESVDHEAVAYHGCGTVDGMPVVSLEQCVGPMLPLADFDDPESLRAHFARLQSGGWASGGFAGLPPLPLLVGPGEPGKRISGELTVPESAAIFADHFPRRALFPGTLLMHVNLELASALAREFPTSRAETRWEVGSLANVKLRAFIAPGERVQLEARYHARVGDELTLSVETRNGSRSLGGARATFVTVPTT